MTKLSVGVCIAKVLINVSDAHKTKTKYGKFIKRRG